METTLTDFFFPSSDLLGHGSDSGDFNGVSSHSHARMAMADDLLLRACSDGYHFPDGKLFGGV